MKQRNGSQAATVRLAVEDDSRIWTTFVRGGSSTVLRIDDGTAGELRWPAGGPR